MPSMFILIRCPFLCVGPSHVLFAVVETQLGIYFELSLRGCGVWETMASVDMTGFRKVSISFGQIHISGGHGGKQLPVDSKTVSDATGNEQMTFVKMSYSEDWLLFATTGQRRYWAGAFGRTSLLLDLRDKLQKYCDGEVSSSSGAKIHSEDYDPMMEVEQGEADNEASPAKIKGQGQKRMRYFRNPNKNSIVTLDMPTRCPEEDAYCTELRQIKLYVKDRKVIWLHIDDVEWAMRYLYVQNLLKGVALVPDDSTGPGGAVG